MNTLRLRTVTSTLVLALTLVSATALAQDARDPLGSWEGYSSRGNFVLITITSGVDGALSAEVTVLEGGIGGPAATEVYGLVHRPTDALHSQFDVSGELGTLDAYWYSNDALRLVIADDLILILARVVTPGASAVPEGAEAPPQEAPTPTE
jgi:hypothetical protein